MLGYVDERPGEVRIGAMTRHNALLESPLLEHRLAIFTDAERVIADPVVRNRGTIGGALCQADPSEDLSAVCAAVKAQLVIRGLTRERVVDMHDFHRGPYETAVGPAEMLVEIRVPLRRGTGSAYLKVDRRVGDWAVVAAGASIELGRRHDRRRRASRSRRSAGTSRSRAAEAALVGEPPSEAALRARGGARAVRMRTRHRSTRIGGLQKARRRRPHGARPQARHRARTTDEGGVRCPPDGPSASCSACWSS